MRKFFLLFFIFLPFFLISSNPIMHVHLADKFFNHQRKFIKDEKKSFILGTLFPDIRYLNVILRDKTHFKNVEIVDVLNSATAFEAGKKFHSFVDEKRDEFIIKNKIYERLNLNFDQRTLYLKFLDDEIAFDKIDLSETINYLDDFDSEEFEVSLSSLSRWHAMLYHYFNNKPSDSLYYISFIKNSFFGIDSIRAYEWSYSLIENSKKEEFLNYFNELITYFNSLF